MKSPKKNRLQTRKVLKAGASEGDFGFLNNCVNIGNEIPQRKAACKPAKVLKVGTSEGDISFSKDLFE